MSETLHSGFEYALYMLAPHLDAHLLAALTLAAAIVLVAAFASAIVLPALARLGFSASPVRDVSEGPDRSVAVLRGRPARPTARPRAPAAAF
ncbi:hypothetical protein BH11ACT3_BH11ACT3_04630 [soil metagenome]